MKKTIVFIILLLLIPLCAVVWAGLDAAGGNLINCRSILSDTDEITLDVGVAGLVTITGTTKIETGGPNLTLNNTNEGSINFIDFRRQNTRRSLIGWKEDEDAFAIQSVGAIKFVVENGLAYITDQGNFHTGTLTSNFRLDAKAGGVIGTVDPCAVLDDLTAGGTFNGTSSDDVDYKVEIDSNDTPDTFKWSDDGGSTWDATDVNLTSSAQTLNNGITVTFNANDGHTTGDYWEFTVTIHNPMWLQDAAGDGVMWVGNDGKVGIGTVTPTFGKLEIYGNGADTTLAIHEDAGSHKAQLHLRSGGGDTKLYNLGATFFIDVESLAQAFTILTDGKVGIGTNAPDSIFHIKANVAGTVGSHPAGQLIIQDPDDTVFGNAVITGYESDGAGNPDQQLWYLGSSSSSNSAIIFLNRRNSKLQLGTNGVSRLTILGNGNVGIGEAAPQDKLEVNGTVLVKDALKFTQDDGAEYIDSDADGTLDLYAGTSIDLHQALTVDTDTLVVDDTNDRVGVRTADPSTALELYYGNVTFQQESAPSACTPALAGAGAGNLSDGVYQYRVTFVTVDGETEIGTLSSNVTVVDHTTDGQVSLTGIPTGTAGIVTARKIYRTVVNSGWPYYCKYLATISDNTTTTYIDNIADASLGAFRLQTNTTGAVMYIGSDRVFEIDTATIALGVGAGIADYSNFANTYIGYEAGKSNQIGYGTTCIGYRAGRLMTGVMNTLIGYQAGDALTTATYNTCIGANAGGSLTTGSGRNTCIGAAAGELATGYFSTFIGYAAGKNTSGGSNIFIGDMAGLANTTGGANIGLGVSTLFSQTTANNNTAIGNYAGYSLTGGGCIFIGNKAGYRQTTNTNLLIIDNQERADAATELTNAILYGVMAAAPANQTLRINASTLVTDKVAFTQTDLNEYIDSLADGYMDYGATTGHRFNNAIAMLERSSDPVEPTEGNCVIWMSDGTGKGDDGDVLIASKAGGTTNWGTLFDHSGGAAW